MQHELEASFIYEDTPDQLKATQDAKADMESDRPMDRLCVVMWVSERLKWLFVLLLRLWLITNRWLCWFPLRCWPISTFRLFSERLKDFPCKVDYLSRARSTKDVSRIVKELADGK